MGIRSFASVCSLKVRTKRYSLEGNDLMKQALKTPIKNDKFKKGSTTEGANGRSKPV